MLTHIHSYKLVPKYVTTHPTHLLHQTKTLGWAFGELENFRHLKLLPDFGPEKALPIDIVRCFAWIRRIATALLSDSL